MNDAIQPDRLVLFKVEQPQPGFVLRPGATLTGRGWAITENAVTEVSVYLGDDFLCDATFGLPRPDLAHDFPAYDGADHAGFAFAARLDHRLAAPPPDLLPPDLLPPDLLPPDLPPPDLLVILRTEDGSELQRIIPSARAAPDDEATAAQDAAQDTAAPAWPIRLAVDAVRIDPTGLLHLQGWAVSRAPLRELLAYLGETRLHPLQRNLRRPDVAANHPDYPDAGLCGFRLVQDVSALAASRALLRVVARGEGGQQRQIVMPIAPPPSPPLLQRDGGIELGCDEILLCDDGLVLLCGWAVAEAGVAGISVALDDATLGLAETGLSRPEIGNRFPRDPLAPYCGFRFSDRIAPPSPGVHRLSVTVRDHHGAAQRMDIPVELQSATRQQPRLGGLLAAPGEMIRLEVDTPAASGDRAAETLRGMLTVSGWAVAQGGIERVEVWLDEARLGEAYLGQRREDVAAAFPDIAGSLRSGYVLTLPQRAISAGWHSLRVVAVARSGRQIERSLQLESQPPERSVIGVLRRRVNQAETDHRLAIIAATGPLPSCLVLIRAASARPLQTTLESLRQQTYPHWRAIVWLPEAASPLPEADLAGRVTIHREATAPVWPEASGGSQMLVCGLLAGDRLGADALLELALESALGTGADFVYADERRHDQATGTIQPWFKPDWSPELLLSTNYLGRAWCATATLLRTAGVDPATWAARGDYDAVLRLTALARAIRHVPRVLFETARPLPSDPDNERRALQAALDRTGMSAELRAGRVSGTWQRLYAMAETPLVSVIIPTCAAGGLIERAIDTLRNRTDYPVIELICIDNIPDERAQWRGWLRAHADQVITLPPPFNWSAFNNRAAAAARGAYLLFLNDDIETDDSAWLRSMLQQAQRPEIGVVGPKLLYPNGTIQHAGMFVSGTQGLHAFRFLDADEAGSFGLAQTQREVTAVTGACMLMRRAVFTALGGFDEAHSIINNDLDFCLRVGRAGLRVLYTPHARLVHHELASRASLADTYDETRFSSAWRSVFLRGDRLHNPNLTVASEEYLPEDEPVDLLYAGHPLLDAASVRAILAVKLDHIGDFLTALPALRRLKRHFPHARLTVLAPRASLQLARLEPAIDEVLEFNFFHPISAKAALEVDPVTIELLQAALAARRFDIAIDLRLQPDTRHVLRDSGARLLAGFDIGGRFPWLDVALEWEGDMRLLHKRAHVTDRLLCLADALGNACLPDRSLLNALPPCAPAARPPLVCIHPGAGNPMKQWPAESYAGLIDLLIEGHGVSVILIGSDDDREIIEAILAGVANPETVVSLAGQVALGDLAAVLAPCALYVGNDSGPKHLAAALGVPTLGVHSGNIDAAEWGPLGPRAVAIRRQVVCSPCYLSLVSDCPRSLACLRGIRVQDVYRACRPLLEFRTQPARRRAEQTFTLRRK